MPGAVVGRTAPIARCTPSFEAPQRDAHTAIGRWQDAKCEPGRLTAAATRAILALHGGSLLGAESAST